MEETKPKEQVNTEPKTPIPPTTMSAQNVNGHSVYLGQLPDDFLRLDSNVGQNSDAPRAQKSQIELDEELAASLQHQYDQQARMAQQQWNSQNQFRAHLSLTFVEAHLVKNYGLINMSPYVRIRVGNTIYETRTCTRGGKNPKWNETLRCCLPAGVDTIAIEIYDDCLFTQDELIAWATYKIPENYLQFDQEHNSHSFEEKIPLSGKLGEGLEGELMLAIVTKPVTAETLRTYIATPVYSPQPMMFAGPPILARPLIVHQSPVPASNVLLPQQDAAPPAPVPQEPVQISDEDVEKLKEMFPNIEIDVIKSILVSERGNLERAITNLLELNSSA